MGCERFLETTIVIEQLEKAGEFLAAGLPNRLREVVTFELTHGLHDRLESPLEAAFSVWWHAISFGEYPEPALRLRQQRTVDLSDRRYRIDFVVEGQNFQWPTSTRPRPKIAIELDGHEFHERTKSQVADRNKRDRDLQLAGWVVFHISGSEFYHQPDRVAIETYNAALKLFRDWFTDAVLSGEPR